MKSVQKTHHSISVNWISWKTFTVEYQFVSDGWCRWTGNCESTDRCYFLEFTGTVRQFWIEAQLQGPVFTQDSGNQSMTSEYLVDSSYFGPTLLFSSRQVLHFLWDKPSQFPVNQGDFNPANHGGWKLCVSGSIFCHRSPTGSSTFQPQHEGLYNNNEKKSQQWYCYSNYTSYATSPLALGLSSAEDFPYFWSLFSPMNTALDSCLKCIKQ